MAKPVKSRGLGKNLLLSVAVGAVPLVGCGPTPSDNLVVAPSGPIAASPEELALFRQASQTGNPTVIANYLRSYPDSRLVRNLLTELPPDTLRLIDNGAVTGVNASILRTLPLDIRSALRLGTLDGPTSADDAARIPSDGYAG